MQATLSRHTPLRPWTLKTGRSIPKVTSDLRSWKGTQIYVRGIVYQGHHKFRAKCGTMYAA